MAGTPMDDNQYISKYTLARAIEDGELVDVTTWAKRAGFKFPVALTRAVWFGIIELEGDSTSMTTGNAGRLGRCLAALIDAARSAHGNVMMFQFSAEDGGQINTLHATLLAGDEFEPVVTVHLPDED